MSPEGFGNKNHYASGLGKILLLSSSGSNRSSLLESETIYEGRLNPAHILAEYKTTPIGPLA